ALGERGRTAEAVAERACEEFSAFHATEGVVDVHMADQLMVFLAIAGGTIRIPTVSDHVRTNLEVVNAFGSDMEIVREGAGPTLSAAGGFGGPPSDRQ
ncbi:MAG: RNA 3'-terminal phosphate cyclase, partial [Halobacteriota archaeon]